MSPAIEARARIGAYEVERELGRGASATIWLAREFFPPREVAIKVYDPQRLSSEDRKVFQSLFLKETLLAKRLKHPNITQVLDFGEIMRKVFAHAGEVGQVRRQGGLSQPQTKTPC